jgi:hypothetical protein
MPSTPQTLKKTLVAEGFEVYRTSPSLIILADRVRDNLLMDSGVAVVHGEPLVVRITLRARPQNFRVTEKTPCLPGREPSPNR